MSKALMLIRKKRYRLRRTGERGVAISIPSYYMDRYGVQAGDECFMTADENGNLVILFKHSPDFKRVDAE